MPRQRRRHHSRSRSRSQSHSHERDRETKRRRIESPQYKRSLSPHSEAEEMQNETEKHAEQEVLLDNQQHVLNIAKKLDSQENNCDSQNLDTDTTLCDKSEKDVASANKKADTSDKLIDNQNLKIDSSSCDESEQEEAVVDNPANTPDELNEIQSLETDTSLCNESEKELTDVDKLDTSNKLSVSHSVVESNVTPNKSPRKMKKNLDVEKRYEEIRKQREKRKQELLEEKLKHKQEKTKLKQEKQEQKQKEFKEKEEKRKKEQQEKEQKRKEKEEKIELKRKEKEEKIEQKRKEQEEKNKEKMKIVEKKQKAAAAFANFFTKKPENMVDDKKLEEIDEGGTLLTFMPFEVKSDMKLAPLCRAKLSSEQKDFLTSALLEYSGALYLDELHGGKKTGKSFKTWPIEEQEDLDDVVIIEDINPGERIEEQPNAIRNLRAKFLKFDDSRRPAYFGTWRKKSTLIRPRRPLALDKNYIDYEYDSDEDWEEEDADMGESLHGSDDEDKENDSDNEYEVDNEFFVPHGHLSEDEIDDEEDFISPEAHKAKLKLLKNEFEAEMQGKTQKIKPRVIGCIWYKKDQVDVDNAIHEFLSPYSIISNGSITIKKRNELFLQTPLRNALTRNLLSKDLIPDFLKVIHGNTNNIRKVITQFLNSLKQKNSNVEVSKTTLRKQWKQFADWIKCPVEGPMFNKYCWYVRNDVMQEYNLDLAVSNK